MIEHRNRGYDHLLVLLPGWGFGVEVFAALDLPFDYLLVDCARPQAAFNEVLHVLASAGELPATCKPSVSLLGWSLGAHLAIDLALAVPECVAHCCLVSLCPRFGAAELAAERKSLQRDPTEHLESFYRRAMVGLRGEQRSTAARLVEASLQSLDVDDLSSGLDYLATRSVTAAQLDQVSATLFHGQRDLIVPAAEITALMRKCSRARIHVERSWGHLPLLDPRFCELVRPALAGKAVR